MSLWCLEKLTYFKSCAEVDDLPVSVMADVGLAKDGSQKVRQCSSNRPIVYTIIYHS